MKLKKITWKYKEGKFNARSWTPTIDNQKVIEINKEKNDFVIDIMGYKSPVQQFPGIDEAKRFAEIGLHNVIENLIEGN